MFCAEIEQTDIYDEEKIHRCGGNVVGHIRIHVNI